MAYTLKGKLDAIAPKQVVVNPADVLDGVQNALVTISGGRVKLVNIVLEVSGAAIDAGANNTKLVFNPTVGADVDLCAVLDVDADVVGTLYSITGTIANALQTGLGIIKVPADQLVLAEGTIDILSAADGGVGGALIGAVVEYIPLDAGAKIV